ncbi:hypothetical protein LINPERPRIM_LOCUS8709 [Linum perenne]
MLMALFPLFFCLSSVVYFYLFSSFLGFHFALLLFACRSCSALFFPCGSGFSLCGHAISVSDLIFQLLVFFLDTKGATLVFVAGTYLSLVDILDPFSFLVV